MGKILILFIAFIRFLDGSSEKNPMYQLNLNPFKLLYSPVREKYIQLLIEGNKINDPTQQKVCPFCAIFAHTNLEKSYVLKEFKYVVVLLNLYPYNSGHILIIPKEHKAILNDLRRATRHEIIEVVNLCTTILSGALKPDGFNIGINLLRSAGATVSDHLHVHVIPRWNGDTNFLLILEGTKPVSMDLDTLYKFLKPLFAKAELAIKS